MKARIKIYTIILIVLTLACTRETTTYTEAQRRAAEETARSIPDDSIPTAIAAYEAKNQQDIAMQLHTRMGLKNRKEGKFNKAIHQHEKAAATAATLPDTVTLITSANNIGTNYRRMGLLKEASTYHYKALRLSESYHDSDTKRKVKNKVISLNGIGNICLTLGNTTEADSMFRAALKGEKELGSDLGQAINYANIGSIYEMNGQTDSAHTYYQKSLEHNIRAHSNLGRALCHTHFGELFEKEGHYKEALEEYHRAYDIMNSGTDRWHWLESTLAIARVHMKSGENSTALQYTDKALETAYSINSYEHLSEAYNIRYRLYDTDGNTDKALDAYIKSREYADKVVNKENLNKLSSLQREYEEESSRREIQLLKENNQVTIRARNLMLSLLITVTILAATIIGILNYYMKTRARRRKKLERLEKLRTNFFTNITHEFRTPLTVILGLSDRLLDDQIKDTKEIRETGQHINRQGRQLLKLINQLLDISKIKTSIGPSRKQYGDIVTYIRMIAESYRPLAETKKIELAYLPGEPTLQTAFTPDYLYKIISNLISNAIKFTPKYGIVHIISRQKGSRYEITFQDNGRGIPADKLPYIYDLMYQVTDNDSDTGTGIGLALVKQIIETIGGTIDVKSQYNIGTEFTITIPLETKQNNLPPLSTLPAATEDTIPIPTQEPAQPAPTNIQGATSILIVEDNADVASYIGTILKDKYTLNYATNGSEGIEKAEEIMPDLIITDIMMPIMDGYDMTRRIRTSNILNHIPVIMITARSEETDRIRGINSGADAYLYKPFNALELQVRVETILETRRLLRSKFSDNIQEAPGQLLENEQQFLNKFIDATYSMMSGGTIYIDDIASTMCMSPRQLGRKIMSITGKSCTAYITEIKMARARRLLDSEPNMPIGDVGIKCGYDDNVYFSRIFKKTFNMTPSQYRKRIK